MPRIAFAFRMESFVCRRERTRYREPKSCPGDDPARQRRSELQAARGLRRSLRRSGGLQRLSLASAIILAAEVIWARSAPWRATRLYGRPPIQIRSISIAAYPSGRVTARPAQP